MRLKLSAAKKRERKTIGRDRTLGFDLGPHVTTAGTIRARGRMTLARMHKFKLVWRSTLSLIMKMYVEKRDENAIQTNYNAFEMQSGKNPGQIELSSFVRS